MADLRERRPGRPPWIPALDPWWVWAIRIGLALMLVFAVGAELYTGTLTVLELVRQAR